MAKATITPVVERVVTLEMSETEATALLGICARIGGSPEGTRGVFSGRPESLSHVLSRILGIYSVNVLDQWVGKRVVTEDSGSFYFND